MKEGKCQIILQNVVRPDLTPNCTVRRNRWEKKRGPFKWNPFFSQEASAENLAPIPRVEASPGKPRPAYWCEQSGARTEMPPDYGTLIGFENTLAQWQWAKYSLPRAAFHCRRLIPYLKCFSFHVPQTFSKEAKYPWCLGLGPSHNQSARYRKKTAQHADFYSGMELTNNSLVLPGASSNMKQIETSSDFQCHGAESKVQ